MTFSEMLLPEFDQEMKNTRKILERVPDGKFDYQPHPKSMTLGRLATHVADIPGWALITLDQDVLDMPPDFKPHIAANKAELLESFDKNVAAARPRIAATTDQQWAEIWTFKVGGQTMMAMPRSSVLRGLVMNHLIHHRAQLGVFLRLNDVAIPGTYGPSADDTNAFQSQTA